MSDGDAHPPPRCWPPNRTLADLCWGHSYRLYRCARWCADSRWAVAMDCLCVSGIAPRHSRRRYSARFPDCPRGLWTVLVRDRAANHRGRSPGTSTCARTYRMEKQNVGERLQIAHAGSERPITVLLRRKNRQPKRRSTHRRGAHELNKGSKWRDWKTSD